MAEPAEYLTLDHIAAITQMSKSYRWLRVKGGELTHVRCGRSIRVPREALDRFMAERQYAGEEPVWAATAPTRKARGASR
jgi:excisionase family DNA binding protein